MMNGGRPRKAKPGGGCDSAWFYECPTRIEVYCYKSGGDAYWCHIPLKMLEDYVRRARAAAKKEKR